MDHATQVQLTKQLLARLDSGLNVDAGGVRPQPTAVYTDPELAAQEWETFFRSQASIIGVSGDLPEPGSFLTTDDLGTPILATRNADGEFRAFVNACRHRGAVLQEDERGTTRRHACRFHRWTYDGDGVLVGLPKRDHFGDVDESCLGLVPLPCAEAHGFLVVHPDPDGTIDLTEVFDPELADELSSWKFGEMKFLGSDTYDVACNWKLALDTFGETYHFTSLHENTLAFTFHGNVQCYDHWDRNHRMVLCKRAIDEMRTWPEEDWDLTVAGLPVYWLFPNTIMMPSDGICFLVRAYPDPNDPGRHRSRISFYLRAEKAPDVADDMLEEGESPLAAAARIMAGAFGEIIRDEDYAMSASQQTTADSGAVAEVLFGRNEPALHHYHDTFRRVLG